MGHLTDEERARILGHNAARLFDFDVERLLSYREA
jgi:predicted TIM-barrel fold metal-dependent hydrolase